MLFTTSNAILAHRFESVKFLEHPEQFVPANRSRKRDLPIACRNALAPRGDVERRRRREVRSNDLAKRYFGAVRRGAGEEAFGRADFHDFVAVHEDNSAGDSTRESHFASVDELGGSEEHRLGSHEEGLRFGDGCSGAAEWTRPSLALPKNAVGTLSLRNWSQKEMWSLAGWCGPLM